MRLFLLLIWITVIFFVATNIQAGWLYVVDSILISIFFLSLIIPYFNLKNLSVDLTSPELTMKGEPINLTLTIINQSRIPKFLIMFNISFDFLSTFQNPKVQNLPKKKFLRKKHKTENEFKEGIIYIPKKDKTQINIQYIPNKRGIIKLNQIEILTSVPFGFKKVTKKFKINNMIYVYPKIFPMNKNFKSKLIKLSLENYPNNIPAGIRNYQPYDSLKMIHWSYSAKYQQIMSKKFETEMIQKNLTLIINDTNQEKFEIVMDTSISLLNFLIGGEKGEINIIPFQNPDITNKYLYEPQIKIGGISNPPEMFHEWNSILKYLTLLKSDNSNQVLNVQKSNNNENYYLVTYKGDNKIDKELENALIISEEDLEIS